MRLDLWSRLRAAWRRRWQRSPADSPPPDALPAGVAERFTFVTSAFDTRPEFLLALAATIASQSSQGARWVIVDNGSLSTDTTVCLAALAGRPFVDVVRVVENAGILGGMRIALQAATTEFVIPVDSDDLLSPHTIGHLGNALLRAPDARFFFSDEDHFTNDVRCNPFYRTGWDPALALASSYIWHLCCFDRDQALRLGVYSDTGANYCHDWDTLLRFVRAGHRPRHVPELLYSWRTHGSSTTNNSGQAHEGSLASQRHVLQQHLQAIGVADRFAVTDCPIWRGAPELRIARTNADLPLLDLAVLGADESTDLTAIEALLPRTIRIDRRWLLSDDSVGADGWRNLPPTLATAVGALADSTALGTILWPAGLTVQDDDALLDLICWLELVPTVALAGGRRLDRHQRVLSNGDHFTKDGRLVCPDAGRVATDPGWFAMALKPRCVPILPDALALVRSSWLQQHAAVLQRTEGTAEQVLPWLCALALGTGHHSVCTPFATCAGSAPSTMDAPTVAALAALADSGLQQFSPRGVWHGSGVEPTRPMSLV